MAPSEHLDEQLNPWAVIPLQLAAAGRCYVSSLRFPGGANKAADGRIRQDECKAAHAVADGIDAAFPGIVQYESFFQLLAALFMACRG